MLLATSSVAWAQSQKKEIVHDAEFYVLKVQHGDKWAAEDKELDAKLAALRKKYGKPPNIIHVMVDDTAVGEVGFPAIQQVRGFSTPNLNKLAREGINFMRMYTEPSCTQSRAAAMAWWPGMIEPHQTSGDILHITDLFTTFARLGGATEHIPTDRIIDGIDQTAMFLNGDSHSRRDYVHVYTGAVYAAPVKGRFKRHWVGELPGLSGANFFDLYNDPREVQGMMLPMFPTKGMFSTMKARHELWMEKYPNAEEAKGLPFTGIANARPETIRASKPRFAKVTFLSMSRKS